MNYRALLLCGLFAISTQAYAQETQTQYLSGKGIDDAVNWDFMVSAGNQSGEWKTLRVPSCWDVEGFGSLSYGRDRVPTMSTESGKYRYKFQAPTNWQGQSVYLVFEGSMTDTEAWVNGQSAGPKHQGAYYQFKYDVTKSMKLGAENLLEVTVDKESANATVNRAERRGDYWNFGGIFRPVYLEAMPTQHVERVAIDAKHDGAFNMDVYTEGGSSVTAQVIDLAGKPVGNSFTAPVTDGKAHLQAKLDTPKQWTAETPNLYQVEVRLMQGNAATHVTRQKFGFRTIEVRAGDGIYVNGQRIMLKGNCRHSFWPEGGRATSERVSKLDVALMKEMNNNAVRMSHYPPDAHFLDACDEMGLYVLDELGGWHGYYETSIGQQVVKAMVTHDVNHPSVLFWDNGNEQSQFNTEVDGDYGKWDPQNRPVLHPWREFSNVDTHHYPNFVDLNKLAAGTAIVMPTEFLHGLFDGGMGAGLQEYWDVMRNSKVFAGGFLWAYVDETVKRKDQNGKMDGAGNQAPDGIVGPYREKEGSFFTVKQVWAPIVLSRNENNLTIENRYDFINTKDCTFTWQLRKFNAPSDPKAEFTVLASEKLTSPTIGPHGNGSIQLNIPPQLVPADVLAIRVDDPQGRELWTYVWPMRSPQDVNRSVVVQKSSGNASAKEDASSIEVTARDLTARFDKTTGYLTSVVRAGKTFTLANGPRLAAGEGKLESISHHADGADQIVEAVYSGDMKSTRWRIKSDGWLELDYAYHLTGQQNFIGVSFDLPEKDVKSKKWLGNGPYHVWKNRLEGGTIGIWENAYNNTMTGYSDWVYPEFKGYFSQVRWMQLETTSGPILLTLDDPSLYVQVLQVAFPGDPKPGQDTSKILSANSWTLQPDAGLSILHAISAIGSKFNAPDKNGTPTGQKAEATGDYHGTVRLFFGEMK